MWTQEHQGHHRDDVFFRLSLAHDSLANFYQVNFAMASSDMYTLSEIEEMMPWERQIHMSLLTNHIKEENKRIERMKQQHG